MFPCKCVIFLEIIKIFFSVFPKSLQIFFPVSTNSVKYPQNFYETIPKCIKNCFKISVIFLPNFFDIDLKSSKFFQNFPLFYKTHLLVIFSLFSYNLSKNFRKLKHNWVALQKLSHFKCMKF